MVRQSIAPNVRKSPPGPRGYPVIGCLPQMLREPLQFLTNAARQYGEVVHLGAMGPRQSYLVVHPDDVRYVLLENNQNYIKGENISQAIKPVIGEGLVITEGDFWRRQRRLIQPAFHRQRVGTLVSVMTSKTAQMIENWSTIAPGTPLNIHVEMMRLTQGILVKSLLSIDSGEEATELLRAWDVVYKYLSDHLWDAIRLLVKLPTPSNRQFQQAMHTLDTVVYRIIRERRQSGNPPDDLLSMLMDACDEPGERMSDQQLRDEILTIFTGGFETSAGMLGWTWYLLSKHPSVERRLQTELTDVLGGRTPTLEDLPNLKYTRMVIEETMRLYPGAWAFTRINLNTDEIGGYQIPANSLIIICPYVTHRLPIFWENPEGFDPERFAPERAAARARYAYYPFGSGPRQCIGEIFAMTEMQLVVAMVAQHYCLHLVPGHPVEEEAMFTLRARYGILMTLKPQSGSGNV